MSQFPHAGRLAGHVLLDSVTAIDDAADHKTNTAAANLAFERLTQIDGAYLVKVEESGEDFNVELDLSNVLGAALVTIEWLVKRAAAAGNVSPETVIADARTYLDA